MLGTLGTEGAELTVAGSPAAAAPLDGRTVVITGASDLFVRELAVRPDPQAVNGAYLHRFNHREWLVASEARDAQLARRLWERSAELTGLPG